MTNELTLLGTLTPDLRLEFSESHSMLRLLKKYMDKTLEITITPYRKQRSSGQNRWMWGVCVITVMAWLYDTQGVKYTKDEVYHYINSVALGRKAVIKEIAGEEVIVLEGKRFSQMTTVEFSDAVEEIVVYFGDRGLEIKLPKKNNLLNEILNDD